HVAPSSHWSSASDSHRSPSFLGVTTQPWTGEHSGISHASFEVQWRSSHVHVSSTHCGLTLQASFTTHCSGPVQQWGTDSWVQPVAVQLSVVQGLPSSQVYAPGTHVAPLQRSS